MLEREHLFEKDDMVSLRLLNGRRLGVSQRVSHELDWCGCWDSS